MRRNLTLLLALLSTICVCRNPQAQGDQGRNRPTRAPFDGAQIFQYYCASCHGSDGRGHGREAAALKQAVPDLTVIARKNGGKFPYRGVRNVIEGVVPVTSAHGTREMPIWGPIFHEVEADQDWGEVRLDAVARHIESIQQK